MSTRLPFSVRQEKVIFMHLPKTGGSSLKEAIRSQIDTSLFCPEEIAEFHFWPPEQLNSYKFFSGHFSWTELDPIQGPRKLVTIVREPVMRTLSAYTYAAAARWEFLEQSGKATHRLLKATPLERLLDGTHLWAKNMLSNVMTKQLAGSCLTAIERANGYQLPWQDEEAMLERAFSNLDKIDFVGLFEDFDRSARELLTSIGVRPPVTVPSLNVTSRNHETIEYYEEAKFPHCSEQLHELVVGANQTDILLYEECRRRYERKYGTAFSILTTHSNIGTAVQSPETSFIHIMPGQSGHAIYGPYTSLSSGRYEVTFSIINLSSPIDGDPVVTLDVVADAEVPLAVMTCCGAELAQYPAFKLQFELLLPVQKIQFRVVSHGRAEILIDQCVALRRIAAPVYNFEGLLVDRRRAAPPIRPTEIDAGSAPHVLNQRAR